MLKQKILYRVILSAFIYYALATYTNYILVIPEQIKGVTSFSASLLGFMWGPAAAIGATFGEFLTTLPSPRCLEILTTVIVAYMPYKLWRTVWVKNDEPLFCFNTRHLLKFIAIIFATNLLTALITGFYFTETEIIKIFSVSNLPVRYPLEMALLRFLNDFGFAILFGMPLFCILISHGYDFFNPNPEQPQKTEKASRMNRFALKILYISFLVLFVVLDRSGMIYGLERSDTWLQFNIEVINMMDLTLAILIYMFLRYRHSIMTNLMLLSIATVFVTSSVLGGFGFMTITGIVGVHIDNDLLKMSVIYRERLSQAFNNARIVVNSMNKLAVNRLDYPRLTSDEIYRRNYFTAMEDDFLDVAENAAGIVGVYVQYSLPTGEDTGFICTRNVTKWGVRLPAFVHQNANPYKDRYHISQERYLDKWSEPYFDEVYKRYIISYIVPLEREEKFIGMVGIDIDFNYIIHEINRMSVYENGYVELLDKNGFVLYTSKKNNDVFKTVSEFYQTETYLSNGVWLRISASAHEVYLQRNILLMHSVVVLFLVVIAVSVFSILLAERGIQPLLMITKAAKKIAEGDLDVKLSYGTKNELGGLVESIKEMVAKLEIYVYRDKLTGLRNTTAYSRKIDKIKNRQMVKPFDYAIAVFDVNFLKRTNDTYGHEAGNELIIRSASLIEQTFAESRIYRIGGDEFVAILEGKDFDNRENLLKKFDEDCAKESFQKNGDIIKVSVARGIAVCQNSEDFADIFKQADAAMYAHKTALKAHRTT